VAATAIHRLCRKIGRHHRPRQGRALVIGDSVGRGRAHVRPRRPARRRLRSRTRLASQERTKNLDRSSAALSGPARSRGHIVGAAVRCDRLACARSAPPAGTRGARRRAGPKHARPRLATTKRASCLGCFAKGTPRLGSVVPPASWEPVRAQRMRARLRELARRRVLSPRAQAVAACFECAARACLRVFGAARSDAVGVPGSADCRRSLASAPHLGRAGGSRARRPLRDC